MIRKKISIFQTKGLGLLELLIVVMMTAIVLTAMMNLLIQVQRVEVRAEAGTRLALFAQKILAEWRAKPFDELRPGEYPISEEYKFPITGRVIITEPRKDALKQIEILCRAELPQGDAEFSLITLRTRPLSIKGKRNEL
ncbi:hypothetical protein J7M23_10685 [Candidatus Sumerlaeota bacterium]|nr:hypothetical protein [Candidatus Sumerlaeota bacterium]